MIACGTQTGCKERPWGSRAGSRTHRCRVGRTAQGGHLIRYVAAPGFLSSRLWYNSRLVLSRYTEFIIVVAPFSRTFAVASPWMLALLVAWDLVGLGPSLGMCGAHSGLMQCIADKASRCTRKKPST